MRTRSAARLGLMCSAAVLWTTACGGLAATADQQAPESDVRFAAEAAGDPYEPLIDLRNSCDRCATVTPKPGVTGRRIDAGSADARQRDGKALDRQTDDAGNLRDPDDTAPIEEPTVEADAAVSEPQDTGLRDPTAEKWVEGGCLGWPTVEFSPSMFA